MSTTGRQNIRPKRRLAAVGVGLAACAALAVGPAAVNSQAQGPGGPQQSDPNPLKTNVPYVAWRGEQLRLVKCTGDLTASETEDLRSSGSNSELEGFVNTDFIVEDWSGHPNFLPAIENGTIDVFFDEDDGFCVKGDAVSQKAGLAMIKLVVTVDPGAPEPLLDLFTRSEIGVKHQFLAAWLNLGTPTLTELPVGGDGPIGTPGTPLSSTGVLNSFYASNRQENNGRLSVSLKGTLPLGNNFSELGLGESLTLPDDWARLAGALAVDQNVDNENPRYRWDIHDDQTAVEGHPFFTGIGDCDDRPVDPALAPRLDAGDNCDGGLAFSSYFDEDGPGGLAGGPPSLSEEPTYGPFDPQRPEETFLPDGALNADDAPMPAARIDIRIDANTGAPADITGVGSLESASKAEYYSRDRLPGDNAGSGSDAAHNLYAPFYSAYIPATGAPDTNASGTDGPGQGNNFPGFLVGDGLGGDGDEADTDQLYDFWDHAHVFRSAVASLTGCTRRFDPTGPPVNSDYRVTPSGDQKVAVYTDEHGEAQVEYNPGTGFYFDNLAGLRNANGGCDLEDIDVLGTSAITAEARYPYQPTTDIAPRVSPTVNKTVRSLFTKFLAVFPKGPSANDARARIVVAHAQDIDGTPFANEVVCFMNTSPNGSISAYVYNGRNARYFGPADAPTRYDLAGAVRAEDPLNLADNRRVCMRTNSDGNAAIEVFESEGGAVDIVADFVEQGLLRDVLINFGVAPAIIDPSTTPVTGGTGGQPTVQAQGTVGPPANNAAGTNPPSATVLAAATNQGEVQVSAAKSKKAKARVRFARITTSSNGKRTLSVRLSSRAKVRIALVDAKGRTKKTLTRTLPGGKTVRISISRSLKVRAVRVTVVG